MIMIMMQDEQKVYTKEDYIRDYNKRLRKMKIDSYKRNLITNLKVILIFSAICIFLWIFPPSHKFIVNFYEENVVLQTIVNTIRQMVTNLKN